MCILPYSISITVIIVGALLSADIIYGCALKLPDKNSSGEISVLRQNDQVTCDKLGERYTH